MPDLNADIADVTAKAEALSLSAVQLHGDEDQAYIDALRAGLAPQVQIWKAPRRASMYA